MLKMKKNDYKIPKYIIVDYGTINEKDNKIFLNYKN